uniref:AlNc14C214G8972 protein n=1 Tax=Albugo laibachii Nc14 TaxID=890382 RepID=F0WRH0_9STRA|nr:AlNc14C214G8972 [Albugo laibachii Nc14]|eukprot:CCA23933.1 AlNc14C214G8972 [Albugo laibachii Nc14]
MTTYRIESSWSQLKGTLGKKKSTDKCMDAMWPHQLRVLSFFHCARNADNVFTRRPESYSLSLQQIHESARGAWHTTVTGQRRIYTLAVEFVNIVHVDRLTWTCTCAHYLTWQIPCRHVMNEADDFLIHPQSPTTSIQPRWNFFRCTVVNAALLRTIECLWHMEAHTKSELRDHPLKAATKEVAKHYCPPRVDKYNIVKHALDPLVKLFLKCHLRNSADAWQSSTNMSHTLLNTGQQMRQPTTAILVTKKNDDAEVDYNESCAMGDVDSDEQRVFSQAIPHDDELQIDSGNE